MSGAGLMEPGHRFCCLFFKIRPGYKVKYHGAEAATYIVIDLISRMHGRMPGMFFNLETQAVLAN